MGDHSMQTNIKLVYFSPTYTTRKILRAIAVGTGLSATELDLTPIDAQTNLIFSPKDLVVIGMPAYGGRVPAVALKRMTDIQGNGAAAVLVVTYGNRDYDDVLLELKDMCAEKGFRVVAASAFVTEHCIVPIIAQGRPNQSDEETARDFGARIMAKLESRKPDSDIAVKGNQPYREHTSLPLRPYGTSKCNACGTCVKLCPVAAIPKDAPRKTDKEACVVCTRCIHICPRKARRFSPVHSFMAARMLKKKCAGEKQPELII